MRRPYLLALAAALVASPFAAPRAARADDPATPLDALEDRALREEARARYEEALSHFQDAFRDAVRDAGAATGPAAERLRARAEVYLEKIDRLAGRTSGHRRVEEFLRGFQGGELGEPLKAWVDWKRVRYLRQAGRTDEARTLVDSLGFVSTWWIVGPFDNERGRGFGTAAGPEGDKGLSVDLAASYKGKEREVSWRRVPARHPFGFVDLDALLRPNNQCLAYAATWIHCEEPREVALRLGSDEGIVAWVNGTEVLRRDLQRSDGFDQDVVGVRLAKGWNRVLLKVAENVGAWGFRLRVTTPDGKPVTDLRFPASDADLEQAVAAPGTSAPAEVLPAVRGAPDALAAAAPAGKTADEGTDDARAYFWMGVLHRAREYDDQKQEQTHRKMFERAAKLRPADAVYRFHAAEAATRPVESSVERAEENEKRRGREKALELDPQYAEAYRALAEYYTFSLRIPGRAEELCRKALEANPEYLEAHLLLVQILRRQGLETEAETTLRALLARPGFASRTEFLREVAAHQDSNGLLNAARDAYLRTLEVDAEDGAARDRLARVLMLEGLEAEAVGIFDERLARNPFDTDAARRKAEFLEGQGDFAGAAKAAAAALEIAPEDDALLKALGRILQRGGEKDAALARWREALRVNPRDTRLKRHLEWLDPSLKPFELPYIEDAAGLLAAVKGAESPERNRENDPSTVVLNKIVTRVNPDGTSSTFTQRIVKILNDQGVRQNPGYNAGGWGGDQAFEWRTARVWRKDGTVEPAQVQSGASFVRWPRLQPGDAWEVQHRVDELRQSFFGDYFGDRQLFVEYTPVERTEYHLITPAAREFRFHTRNMPAGTEKPVVTETPDGKSRVYAWRLPARPKLKREPAMASPLESQPMVEVTTYRDWNHFSEWWWNLIKKQFTVDDDLRAKVAELTQGKETRLEKVKAIYDFVVTDIQYQAWEFGVHGYKPYTATSIFHRKWGDCKDKAILMRTMLGEAGIEAFPVLIMAENGGRPEQDMTLAQVGHFNHCIAFVPDSDGKGTGLFLDGTAQYNSFRNVPTMDRGAKVLVVRPDGGHLAEIPWNTPEEFGLDQEYAVKLSGDGTASFDAKTTFRGDFSVQARNMFSVEGKRNLRLEEILGPNFPKLKLGETSFPDLKDLSDPVVVIGAKFESAWAERDGDRMSLPVKFVELFNLAGLAGLETREHDIVIMNPLSTHARATVELPEGWKVSRLPEARELDSPFLAYRVTAREEGGKIRFERTFTLKSNRIPRDQYARFREIIAAMGQSATEKIVLEKVAAAPARDGD
jgi:tetratricopeptide (TPR) repeat protein